jgi:fructokinase
MTDPTDIATATASTRTQASSVLVVGEALVDLFDSGPQAGGAPFNVARSLAVLGVPVVFVTKVGDGDEAAKVLLQSARNFGVPTHGFQHDASYPTGTVRVVQQGASHTFEIAEDVAWDYINLVQATAAVGGVQPAFFYFGTLAQRHLVSRHTIRELAGSTQATRYVDLNLRDGPDNQSLVEQSLALADWVKVNDEELFQLLEWFEGADKHSTTWGTPELPRGIASLINRFGLKRLIVTRGDQGYACFDALGQCEAEVQGVHQAHVVDTVGAGDGFSAMLIASCVQGFDIRQALQRANAYASHICGHRGPMSADMQTYAHWRSTLATATTRT